MSQERKISHIYSAIPTIEGAGVHLKRVFGHREAPIFDPFLLLDDFHSDNKDDYIAGFPWKTHRRTCSLVRSNRDEYGRRTSPGIRRVPERYVY